MWSLLIVPVKPARQVARPAVRRWIRDRIGPFAQKGLDEPLGFAVGLGRIGPGANVAQPQQAHRLREQLRHVGRPVVRHDPLGAHASCAEPAQSSDEEAGGRATALVVQDLDIGEAGGVVDGDMDEVPARASVAPRAPVARAAMARPLETAQLLDVEMDQFAAFVFIRLAAGR